MNPTHCITLAEAGLFGGGSMLPAIIVIGFLFYFLMVRPENRKRREHKNMLEVMKKNDRVVTIGGIKGTIMNIQRDADEITLKVDESTGGKLRVQVSAIARVVVDESKEKEN